MSATAHLPQQFGRYRIVKLLGSGAMGAVQFRTAARSPADEGEPGGRRVTRPRLWVCTVLIAGFDTSQVHGGKSLELPGKVPTQAKR